MGVAEDLQVIQLIPRAELAGWINRRFAESVPPQWWNAVFEAIEAGASPFRATSTEHQRGMLELGTRLIDLAGSRGEASPTLMTYWNLRLAALALRSDAPITSLESRLTPDGAARWAIESIPLTRDTTLEYAVIRTAEYESAGEDFYASPGEVKSHWLASDPRLRLLQETERIIDALQWVEGAVEDEHLRAEIVAWLSIRDHL